VHQGDQKGLVCEWLGRHLNTDRSSGRRGSPNNFIDNQGGISYFLKEAGKNLNSSFVEIVIFFIIVQSTAILGSIVFGIITDHIVPKKTITITLLIWIIVVIGALLAASKLTFYIVGLLAGASIGSSQSSSRSLRALLTPKNRAAEFFGFYDGLCGKASAVVGPFLFRLI
jgi:UMF1 family MFS transporter